jgi:small nuclear ribonucleoprotein (snRNP)-like protein
MNIRATILCSTLLFPGILFAREKSDVIVMNNGDRFTGEIKGLDSGVLFVSFDYMDGTSSIQWSKVHHLESKQLFVVKTEDGEVYSGTLDTVEGSAGRPINIQISESSERAEEVEQSHIVEVYQTADSFWRRFDGEVNSGIMYSKGNQTTQYNLSSSVEYPRERWSAGANISSSLASSSGDSASTRNSLGIDALRLLRWNNWYYSGLGNFLQSSTQDIRLQTNLSGGIGRYLKNTNHAKISLLAGLAWQNTDYSQSSHSLASPNIAAAVVATQVKLFRFDKTNLDITATVFPALTQPGRVFFNTNATYYVRLYRRLTWNVSFYGNWDNQPPPHFSGSDYGTSSGIGWKFGNR